jgi:hypothetical protein
VKTKEQPEPIADPNQGVRRYSTLIEKPVSFVPEKTIKDIHQKVEARGIERRKSFFRERESARDSSELDVMDGIEPEEEPRIVQSPRPVLRRESRRLSHSQAKSLEVLFNRYVEVHDGTSDSHREVVTESTASSHDCL